MTEVEITTLDELPVGGLRLVKAGGKRLLVTRTSDAVLVTDNACPHEGYGLVQGEVADGTLTCTWHNWKFRVSDGVCTTGEEDLRAYPVRIEGGRVLADLSDPPAEELRPRLLASLRRGVDDGYVGQISRDVVRLLRADADPAQVVWEAVAWGAPRQEFGFGHALASLSDCLAMAQQAEGDARALPIVQAIAGVTETERRRPVRLQPAPADLPSAPAAAFRRAVEIEDLEGAEALVLGALRAGLGPDELKPWFIGVAADHHLGYGHGGIYVQKAFEVVDLLGWDRAGTVLPTLVPSLGNQTREDKLPYMRPFVKALATVDLGAMADGRVPGASADELHTALLDGDAAAIPDVAGRSEVDALLDAVVLAASERLLRYDPAVDADDDVDFGWLDITHALTYARAARWAWHALPSPDSARLALWSAFLVRYAGRTGYRALADADVHVAAPKPEALARLSLGDHAGSFIVTAHLVKTACAAVEEASTIGSDRPLAAAQRFIESPKRDRFVALNTRKAIDVADGKVPS